MKHHRLDTFGYGALGAGVLLLAALCAIAAADLVGRLVAVLLNEFGSLTAVSAWSPSAQAATGITVFLVGPLAVAAAGHWLIGRCIRDKAFAQLIQVVWLIAILSMLPGRDAVAASLQPAGASRFADWTQLAGGGVLAALGVALLYQFVKWANGEPDAAQETSTKPS